MDKQNLMPQALQPVNRSTTGQLPDVLAELSEEALQLHGDSAQAAAAVFASQKSVMLLFFRRGRRRRIGSHSTYV
jgi:bacteriocin leader peptide (microcyclamide/patellamide family)